MTRLKLPRKKPHPYSEKDQAWYDSHIPNPIVKDKAIKFHKELGWDGIRNPLVERGVFGKSIVRDGNKKDGAYLLALDIEGGTSLVAACDQVTGFKKPSDTPRGDMCDIYVNGKMIATVDNIEGRSVKKDPINKSLMGKKLVKEITDTGKTSRGEKVGKIKRTKILQGELILNADTDPNKPLNLFTKNPVIVGPTQKPWESPFQTYGSLSIAIKEKEDTEKGPTYPCRITTAKIEKNKDAMHKLGKNGERYDTIDEKYLYNPNILDTLGFKCVNHAKIIDRKEEKKYQFML